MGPEYQAHSIGDLYISILLLLCVVLDLPTAAPGWLNVSVVPHDDKVRVDSASIPYQTRSQPEDSGDPTTSTSEEPREDWGITLD